MLEAALSYARRGWSVFPLHTVHGERCSCGDLACGSPGKHPRGDLAPNGTKNATTSAVVIRAWWAAHPDSNVGIATGAVSGITVLDVDAETGGYESLDALERQHGRLPRTLRVRTGSGGEHVYFAYSGRHLKNRAGKLAPGLDCRCCGGYVVAPPSVHTKGTYLWIDEDLAA